MVLNKALDVSLHLLCVNVPNNRTHFAEYVLFFAYLYTLLTTQIKYVSMYIVRKGGKRNGN